MQRWMDSKDYARGAVAMAERKADLIAKRDARKSEESGLLQQLNDPSFREQTHQVAAMALVKDGESAPEEILPGVRTRLKEIAKEKPILRAAIAIAEEMYQERAREATGKFRKELRPTHIELLDSESDHVIAVLVDDQRERAFRTSLIADGVSFAGGDLQGVPLPRGRLLNWLKKVGAAYPEIELTKKLKKARLEL